MVVAVGDIIGHGRYYWPWDGMVVEGEGTRADNWFFKVERVGFAGQNIEDRMG